MRLPCLSLLSALVIGFAHAGSVSAVAIEATDLDTLTLGPAIVGPVGPSVDTSLVTATGDSLGDLSSRVNCPAGVSPCVPPDNPSDTIYTYVHTVIPGVDNPNDPPFPRPDTVLSPMGVKQFRLAVAPQGFTGVAGVSFTQAGAALKSGPGAVHIELVDDGLIWTLPAGEGWDTGEPLTFFWQTRRPPSGPGGDYRLAAADLTPSGEGPRPSGGSAEIDEPAPSALLLLGLVLLAALGWRERRGRRH